MPPVPSNIPARALFARPIRSLRRAAPGFTLVEILTATAIMSLMVSLVMVILTQVMTAWNRSTDNLTFSTNARFVFDTIAQDLQGCILRSDGNQWFSLTTDNPPNGANIPAAADSRLIFFTSTPMHQSKDSSSPGGVGKTIAGDICAVEYRVVYADPFGTAPTPGTGTTSSTFSLHRVVIDPVSTFYGIGGTPIMGVNYNTHPPDLVSAFNNVDLPAATTIPANNTTPAVAIPYGSAGGSSPLEVPIFGAYSISNTLLDNVAQFTVYIYYTGQSAADLSMPVQTYPQYTVSISATPSIFYGGAQNPTPTSGYLDGLTPTSKVVFLGLAYADITLTILTDDGVTILQQGNGTLPQNMSWQEFMQKFGKTFTQRVPLLVKPH